MKELRRQESKDWIEHLRLSPNETLKELYQLHQGEFQQWISDQYGLNAAEAGDIFQETMLGLYQNVRLGKLTELKSSIKTYIFAIGKNQAIAHLRKYRREEHLDQESYQYKSDRETAQNYWSEEDDQASERVQQIQTLLQKLKDPCKTIITSFYYHRKSMVEIAEDLNYNNPNVAKAQKYRCMSKFLGHISKKP